MPGNPRHHHRHHHRRRHHRTYPRLGRVLSRCHGDAHLSGCAAAVSVLLHGVGCDRDVTSCDLARRCVLRGEAACEYPGKYFSRGHLSDCAPAVSVYQ